MATKIQSELTHAQFEEFCARLLALPGKARTLAGIQALASEYGITVSHEGARAFKKGPFARHLEKLHRSREAREALVAAAGVGVHPLDALEEAAIIELQDHLAEAEAVDVAWVASQLVKLRSALTMREDSRRKDRDLERRLAESEKRNAVSDARVAKLEREKTEWEEQRRKVAEAANQLRNATPASADEIRAKVVTELDRIMGIA